MRRRAAARLIGWIAPLVLLSGWLAGSLAGCAAKPVPASPAIWLVEDGRGGRAWLFGTIHGFERPVAWNTGPVARALGEADMLMVEVANLDDSAALARTFDRLAQTPGQPPLSQRVSPQVRGDLLRLLDTLGLDEARFASTETWAAALTLARAASAGQRAEHGIDRAVMEQSAGRPMVELEGAASQLSLFDALPEKEQRDLLEAIVHEAATSDAPTSGAPTSDRDRADIAEAWRRGDMAALERESRRGLLADPELRAALFTSRNARWAQRIAQALDQGHRPFVAVGAAHMAGPEGLPAMLADRGLTVTRLQ